MSAYLKGQTDGMIDGIAHSDALRDGLACGVIVCDGAGLITHLTAEAEALIRLKADKAVGQSVSILPEAVKKAVTSALSSNRSSANHLVTFTNNNSESPSLQARVSLFPDTTQGKPGVIIIVNNSTAAHRLRQSMARLDRLANIGTLAASLAHEIKNGLVAIKTFVDLLLEKNQDAELADLVSREMKRIDSLAGQMLRVASPAKAGLAPVRVHELIDHTLRLVQHQLDEKLIAVRRSFNAESQVITGNSYQLEQAFMNLLLNALEAMGPNGELQVATETSPAGTEPGRITITFKDTGIGIPPEDLDHVFDTFFTTKSNGTGLGLAITRRIIHEHEGEIFVESRPNTGATFRLCLPLAKTSA